MRNSKEDQMNSNIISSQQEFNSQNFNTDSSQKKEDSFNSQDSIKEQEVYDQSENICLTNQNNKKQEMVDIDKQRIKLIQKDQDQDQIFQGNQILVENKKYQNKVQNQNQDKSQIDLTSIQKKNSQNLPLLMEDQNSETIHKNKMFFENQEQSQNNNQWQQSIYSRKQSRDLGRKNIEQDIFAGFSLALQKAKNMALQEKIKRIWLAHYRDTEGYRKKNLGQKQLRLIFDLGSASIKQVDLNLFKQSFEKIMKQFGCFTRKVLGLLKYIKLLHPNHKLITMLQIIESIFIIQLFFTYTWYIFFDFTNTGFQLCQDLVGLVIFTFSAVVRMNTSYYDQGDLVEDRLKIFARYKKSLVYDACAFWALIYNMSTIQDATYVQRIMVLPIFAKTQTLVDSVEGLIQKISIQGKVFYMYELVKLLAQAVILCHVFGTLFWILGQFEHHILDDKLNWINNKGIIDAHWYEQYMESFYWAQATIMLVGTKGDTFIETCYACTVLFITVGYFAIILSAIANLLQDYQDREKELKENKQIITSFINEQSVKTDIPQDLQGKMINFLVFHFSGHQDQKDNQKVSHAYILVELCEFYQVYIVAINPKRFLFRL
ncbi:hypothetical protein PPERSA_03100 [Pseudocohnilembus persalinus]|uniref:Ion transport domain-containing protein n=1 Tax=Pseudocohnilembus persalinus TaxID=266149 RepID=A0A0V0QRY8_PSEPJ|nr:hypothetical protein PPERSA_03100 [Pseudocohnilembus persalinus]|eukprot:KRX04709.1 hypothetical protein PPERSA_03100 [Pseudocohnilembus persalinus]